MAGGDCIEPLLPARVAPTESSRPGSDDCANRPRGSGLADRYDAVCLGTASTPGRSVAVALSISGPGRLAGASGLSVHAPVRSATSAGTTTTAPRIATAANSNAVED